MTDPGKPSFLPFARGVGGKLDPGIFTFLSFARVNSEKSSVSLAHTLSIAAPPAAFSAALLPQLRRQQHSQRRTAFSSIGSGTNDSGKRIRQVLARVQYSKCPWQIVFLSFIRVAWGGLPPAYSLFSRLPGRGGMTDPCNCLFSHFPGARAIYSILTKQDRLLPLQHKSRWNHLIPAA